MPSSPPEPAVRRSRRPVAWVTLVLLAWIGIVAVAGMAFGRIADVVENDNAAFLPASAEATRAAELQKNFSAGEPAPAVVVYERTTGITDADRAAVGADAAAFGRLDGVTGAVVGPIPSQDGQALQVIVPIDGADFEQLPDRVEAIASIAEDTPGLSAHVTGPAGLGADFSKAFEGIDTKLLLVTGLVVTLILLLVYRSPVLWLLPLISAVVALSASVGAVYLLAKADLLTLNGQSQGILYVLVFGAGTDYALLLIARYREELHRYADRYQAMRVAWRSAAPAIAASAATVSLGLLCLLVSDLASNRSLGPVAAIGICCALLVMLTFLPALLLLTGRFVFWPFIPRYGSPTHGPAREGEAATSDSAAALGDGIWARVARLVGRRARVSWIASTLLLGVLAIGLTGLKADGLAQTDSFTTEAPSIVGQEVLTRHYPAGSGTPAVVIGRAEQAQQLASVARTVPGVAEAGYPGGTPRVVNGYVQLDVVLADAPDSPQAEETVERLRGALDSVPGPEALVGGFTAIDADIREASRHDRKVIIPLVLLVILLVLIVLLRALVAPLLLLLTVVLSFAATLGVCAVLFNHVFDFAGADPSFPLFAFVFLVALGIDYNIFLMTRVREEAAQAGTRVGTLKALSATGGVITSAGVVLAATFMVLAVLPLVFLAQVGIAVAFGVLLDSLLVRSILVPALTYDVGPKVWWPGRSKGDQGALATSPGEEATSSG